MHMHSIAQKLFGDDFEWSVLAAGRHQMPFATQAATMGGNLRVGLEDSLYIGKGELAKSNAEQVSKIRGIIEALGHTVATPAEARERLAPKGPGKIPKLFYGTQIEVRPPTILVFVNEPELFTGQYDRYLQNRLREAFDWKEIPIRIVYKKREKVELPEL